MNDMNLFLPERWLVPREKSNVSDSGVQEVVFDSTAGPKMAFGGGPRGCYGRRLAYLELKLLFSLIVWDFELLECPKELSGYQGIDGVVHKPVNCYVRLKQLF
jgi:cytochrome P450